jgi:hypothetical protein
VRNNTTSSGRTKSAARCAALAGAILLLGSSFATAEDDKVEALLNDLKSPNAGTRAMAAMTLGRLGPGAKAAVPGLADAVVDWNLNVRCYAAEALKAVGPEAKAAVPALIKALDTFPEKARHPWKLRSGTTPTLAAWWPKLWAPSELEQGKPFRRSKRRWPTRIRVFEPRPPKP